MLYDDDYYKLKDKGGIICYYWHTLSFLDDMIVMLLFWMVTCINTLMLTSVVVD